MVRWVDPRTLLPHEDTHSPHVSSLVAFFSSTPHSTPVALPVIHNHVILDGHHRTLACIHLGLPLIPVWDVGNLLHLVKVYSRENNSLISIDDVVSGARARGALSSSGSTSRQVELGLSTDCSNPAYSITGLTMHSPLPLSSVTSIVGLYPNTTHNLTTPDTHPNTTTSNTSTPNTTTSSNTTPNNFILNTTTPKATANTAFGIKGTRHVFIDSESFEELELETVSPKVEWGAWISAADLGTESLSSPMALASSLCAALPSRSLAIN